MLEPMRDIPAPQNVRGLLRSEYERLVDLGVFEDVRVELLEGQLVEMSPQGEGHATLTARLAGWLWPAVGSDMQLRQYSPMRAGLRSMPEPDISVIPLKKGYFHPDFAYLIVEVSDSSIHNDRNVKTLIYARAGVVEYWILNVQREQIEVHRDPSEDGYATMFVAKAGETLQPVALPKASVDVAQLFAE